MNHGVVAFGKELLLLFQPEENENVLRMDMTEVLVEPGILLKATKPAQIPALILGLFLLSFRAALHFLFSCQVCIVKLPNQSQEFVGWEVLHHRSWSEKVTWDQ